ncbi:undecaprenyl-diphosphate phosphatase [Pelagibacterales bacterium SAG-MED05]|nr:undecaprenyl-diphosphate phosphatase [Pelagibacterales bacterium SAG-MED05]
MVEIIILSLIQGVTEFLPISSSSHLIIVSEYLEFNNRNLEFDVSLHIGSFLAVMVFFRKDIFNFVQNKDLFLKILIASLPVMIVGYLLIRLNLIDQIRNIKVIGWTTLIFGILLYLSDRSEIKKKINSNFTLKSAVLIGFLQILSLLPGVSRSGISITGARMLKFNRFDSAKISFLLSIPTLAAVSVFGLNNLLKSENFNFSFLIILSIIFSYLFSFITIKYFLNYIKKSSLNIFVIYRILLGLILLILAYL